MEIQQRQQQQPKNKGILLTSSTSAEIQELLS